MGWLYNTNATKINNFTIANDNNPATCTDETTDITYINTNFSDNSDMEPDIFTVQAPGLNCQIVYDQINHIFRPIPYQDIKISYTLNSSQNSLIAFLITNDQGIQYSFSTPESVTQTASSTKPAAIIYFKRPYTLYQSGITYNQKWYLTRITDLSGNYISMSYVNNIVTRNVVTPQTIFTSSTSTGGESTTTVLYSMTQLYNPELVSTITSYNKVTNLGNNDAVKFNYTTTTDPAGVLLSNIVLNINKRTLACIYQKVNTATRDYLTSFGESGCSSGGVNYNSNLYQFAYTATNFSGGGYNIADTRFDGTYQDYWGFPNNNAEIVQIPQIYVYPPNSSYPNLERYRLYPVPGYTGTSYTLTGFYKSVDPSITMGSLAQIIYPTGGSTSFTYQPNDYYDVSAATTYQGGGLRISQIVDFDGISSGNNITKNYSYSNPSTGASTGKPICMPLFAFTVPYSGSATGYNYWDTSTVRLCHSNSNQCESIVYGIVTVQQTGAGKTVYQFSTPGTFWDTYAIPVAGGSPDWYPTIVDAGRSQSGGSCPSIGSLINAEYAFPFPPNTNYDFERGLPLSVTSYNESGSQVSQDNYTYQRSFQYATPITALKFDVNIGAEGYSKYQIFSATSELISVNKLTVNDLNNSTNNPSEQLSTTTNYYYLSANHKWPTKIEKDNTDGSIDRTYVQYVKDYSFSGTLDQTMTTIKGLDSLNANLAIEKYYTVTRSSVERTMKADLVKYASFGSGLGSPSTIFLPSQKLNFISSAGITNFLPSSNTGGSFTYYSGYFPIANFTAYNYFGSSLSLNDNYNNVKTQLVDDNLLLPWAIVTNANFNELAYSNFDGSDADYGFTQTGCTTNSSISRTGPNSLSFPVAGIIQTSKILKANAKNYVLSVWVNASTAGTLTAALYNTVGGFVSNTTISFISSGTGWNYYEQKINVSTLTASFTVKLQTSAAINIDDVLLYPENSEVSCFAYDPYTFLKTAETNTNGVSSYYAYDQFYRPQYKYDQDHNIILKRTYASANTIASGLISASFTTSPSSGLNVGATATFTGFTGSGACVSGTYYSYNFGDGNSTTPSLTGANATHSYSIAGTYTVTLTVTNSIFGTKSYNQQVIALMIPQACQSGVWAYVAPTVYTEACPPNPNDNTHSYFTINSITGLPTGHTVSYQWQIAYTATGSNCGSESWTNIGTNVSQYIKSFSGSTFCPYNIRCIITDTNNGQQVTSLTMSVQNNTN